MGILKFINIKAPKTINDLRICHLDALTNEKFQTNLSLENIIEFLSVITSGTKNELRKVNITELKDIFVHCLGLFKDYQIVDPNKTITIEGKEYSLVDPKKVGIGWHIDISNSDIKNDPARLAALMYIEKGTNYGELDENKNMVYSNLERQKIFEKHLPLPDYLNLVSFFLRQSIELTSNYMENPKKRKAMLKSLIAIRGKN